MRLKVLDVMQARAGQQCGEPLFALKQRQLAEVAIVDRQQIEGVEARGLYRRCNLRRTSAADYRSPT